MNAAARVINQSNVFDGQLSQLEISRQFLMTILLSLAVLISALAVIYSTNSYRSVFSQVEEAEQQAHQLQMQWGQLLLEQASLASPSRVQHLAHVKLGMAQPLAKKIVVIQAR